MARRPHTKRKKNQRHYQNELDHPSRYSHNIVELNSRQLETAYAPARASQPLRAFHEAQPRYINAIKTQPLTFGIRPAGTGTTYSPPPATAIPLFSSTPDSWNPPTPLRVLRNLCAHLTRPNNATSTQ